MTIDKVVDIMACIGLVTISFATLIEVFTLAFGFSRLWERPRGTTQTPGGGLTATMGFTSERRLLQGKVSDDMKIEVLM